MDHEELLRDIAALGEEFGRLGTRLAEAAQALRERGIAPPSQLLDDLAAARVGFQRLRARVVELAGGAEHTPLALRDDLDSLQGLIAVIRELTDRQQRYAAIEQARQAALVILDRVAVLGHREDPAFAPLVACQATAATLSHAVTGATPGLHPDVEALVTGTHPLAVLVTFVHRLANIGDDEWERLLDTVAGAFGRPLALAASRGKLVFTTERAGGAPAAVAAAPAAAPPPAPSAPAVAVAAPPAAPSAPAVAVAAPPPTPSVPATAAPAPASPPAPGPAAVASPAPATERDEVDEVARALETDATWTEPVAPAPVDTVVTEPAAATITSGAPVVAAPPEAVAPAPAAATVEAVSEAPMAPPVSEVPLAPPVSEAPMAPPMEDIEDVEEAPGPVTVPEPTLSATAQPAWDAALAAAEQRGIAAALRAAPPPGLEEMAAMREHAAELAEFAGDVRRLRYFHAVAIGVGASVAVPRAFAGPFPSKLGYPELTVLDSLDPVAIRRVIGHLDLLHTLFLVHAGAELPAETAALYRHCREQAEHALPNAGKQFVAITTAGSPLEALAQEQQFRRTFLLPPELVDARGALSWAGIVPAALIGVNLPGFLGRARDMAGRCAAATADNPGIGLGAALAGLAQAGRNKVTLVLSPRLEPFGGWAEQLLAGLGRADGKGLVPIVGESLGAPGSYGPDRAFVSITLAGEPESDARLQALEVVGHPVYRIVLGDPLDLGAEMVRWQVAAATAATLLDVPPPTPPRKETGMRPMRRLGEGKPSVQEGGLRLYTDPPGKLATVGEGLAGLLSQGKAGGCVTLLPYLATDAEAATLLNALRTVLRDRLKLATRVGRTAGYLQATGQPATISDGLYLQITSDDREDLPVPGERQTFGGLKRSQALADFQALRDAGRAVVRVHLDGMPAAGLRRLNEMVARALARS